MLPDLAGHSSLALAKAIDVLIGLVVDQCRPRLTRITRRA
jgi:hypothetical protein